jgi:hypothetical protein
LKRDAGEQNGARRAPLQGTEDGDDVRGEEVAKTRVSAKRTGLVFAEFRTDVAGGQGLVKQRRIFSIRFVWRRIEVV